MLRLGLVGAGALLTPTARAALRQPLLSGVRLSTQRPFLGDGPALATLGMAPGRDSARLQFVLRRPALVTLETLVTGQGATAEQLATDATQQTVGTRTLSLRPGSHALDWVPDVTLKPRTYLLRLRVEALRAQVGDQRVESIDLGYWRPPVPVRLG